MTMMATNASATMLEAIIKLVCQAASAGGSVVTTDIEIQTMVITVKL